MNDATQQVQVRRATPADAAALADLGARTFVDSFGRLYSQPDLQAFLARTHSPSAYAGMLADPDCALWIAERDGTPVGYAQAGACGLPHPDARPEHGELKRLYLDAPAQNCGIGARLFDAAIAWLERDGPRPLWIGVWSENIGAQRFYARRGFERVGEYEFPVGEQRDREFIFRRDP